MNENKIVKFRCSRCGETVEGTMHPFIDAGCQANLKQEIINGTLFAFVCPHCGYRTNLGYDLVYLDRKKKLLISLSHESHADKMPSFSDLSIEESERDQYTVRIVHTPSDLREKILIRDAGLSDQAVELMKVLITSEIQSQENVLVDDLVYAKMDGKDAFQMIKDGRFAGFVQWPEGMYDEILQKLMVNMTGDAILNESVVSRDWAMTVLYQKALLQN